MENNAENIKLVNNESKLIQLSEHHRQLVENLKKALYLSQIGFLEAGRYLYIIKKKRTYLTEDFAGNITFGEFLQRPDLPLPGHTYESKQRIAQKLIRIYKYFLLHKKLDEDKLAPIGYSKLDMIIPVVKKDESLLEEWLVKAATLTVDDLRIELLQRNQSLNQILSCPHNEIEEITFWRCKNCKTAWKNNPIKEKQETNEQEIINEEIIPEQEAMQEVIQEENIIEDDINPELNQFKQI